MGRSLAAICLAALGCSTLFAASPSEVSTMLLSQPATRRVSNAEGHYSAGQREFKGSNGFSLVATAVKYEPTSPHRKGEQLLELKFVSNATNNTSVCLGDHGANGISNGDYATLEHTFTSGEKITITITYQDNLRIVANSTIAREGVVISQSDFDTGDYFVLASYARWRVEKGMKKEGILYDRMAADMLQGSCPDLPYGELSTALESAERVFHDQRYPNVSAVGKVVSKALTRTMKEQPKSKYLSVRNER